MGNRVNPGISRADDRNRWRLRWWRENERFEYDAS